MNKISIRLFIVYSILSISALLAGALLYLIGKEIVIIRWPSYTQSMIEKKFTQDRIKKNIRLSFWQHNRWNSETIDSIWSTIPEENLASVVRSLLTLLEEEQVIEKKTSLQAAVFSGTNHDAYISFDRAPFNEESSQLHKLMIIESFLKTIRENDINSSTIYFLVHHQPLEDAHIDFSHGWPIEGFLAINEPSRP